MVPNPWPGGELVADLHFSCRGGRYAVGECVVGAGNDDGENEEDRDNSAPGVIGAAHGVGIYSFHTVFFSIDAVWI